MNHYLTLFQLKYFVMCKFFIKPYNNNCDIDVISNSHPTDDFEFSLKFTTFEAISIKKNINK